MIRSLMVQECKAHQILAVIGMLALTTLLIPRTHNIETEKISNGGDKSSGDNIENKWKKYHIDTIVALAESWGVFTVWRKLTETDGWKVLPDEDYIIQCLLQHNGTHLSMLGESPFAKGDLVDALGKDGEGGAVEAILK